jgi:hypothetical protein
MHLNSKALANDLDCGLGPTYILTVGIDTGHRRANHMPWVKLRLLQQHRCTPTTTILFRGSTFRMGCRKCQDHRRLNPRGLYHRPTTHIMLDLNDQCYRPEMGMRTFCPNQTSSPLGRQRSVAQL